MADYEVTIRRAARKELQRLPFALMSRILVKVEQLAREPRPAGCRKLRNEENAWRIRIGDYRVLYEVDDKSKVVDVAAIRHRRDAYR